MKIRILTLFILVLLIISGGCKSSSPLQEMIPQFKSGESRIYRVIMNNVIEIENSREKPITLNIKQTVEIVVKKIEGDHTVLEIKTLLDDLTILEGNTALLFPEEIRSLMEFLISKNSKITVIVNKKSGTIINVLKDENSNEIWKQKLAVLSPQLREIMESFNLADYEPFSSERQFDFSFFFGGSGHPSKSNGINSTQKERILSRDNTSIVISVETTFLGKTLANSTIVKTSGVQTDTYVISAKNYWPKSIETTTILRSLYESPGQENSHLLQEFKTTIHLLE
ncbi:MAG: hypothetical protein L3J12_08480 [Spirochaetales bacterium]|nr:hypothetical protein [Spirochaetales bacterium]